MNLNPQFLKPQDILFLLKLVILKGPSSIFPTVPEALGLSKAEVHNSAKRVRAARLLPHDSWNPLRKNLLEFLVHGVKYVFPARHGSASIGMPTAYAAPPLNAQIAASSAELPVWPDPASNARGQALYSLYPSAPQAARRDPQLYELLAVVEIDLVIRYGGEEFLIILLDSEEEAADHVAENIRAAVEKMKVQVAGIALQKTISIGISSFPKDSETFWQAVKFADVALYQAKEQGRNRVIRFNPEMWTDKKEY